MSIPSVLVALTLCAAAPASPATPQRALKASAARVQMMRMPLAFEANRGQFDPRVRYMTRSGRTSIFLTDSEAVLVLPGKPLAAAVKPRDGRASERRGPGAVLRMQLVGAQTAPVVAGARKLRGVVNYLRGKDPKQWRTGIPTYRQVRCAGVYPGTDLVYYGNPRRLEYDFVLKPGSDPARIRLAFQGAERLRVSARGDLIATTAVGDVTLKRPFAYQTIANRRVQVACDYSIAPRTQAVSFRLARYDATRPLVVDPYLEYSTFLGGSYGDLGNGLAVDSSGCALVCGSTWEAAFPTTRGAFNRNYTGGDNDAFVSKLLPDGSDLVYSTFLGGSGDDYATALAIDPVGAAYVTGYTDWWNDFPLTSDITPAFTPISTFVTKLEPTGSSLEYSTLVAFPHQGWPVQDTLDPSFAVHARGLAVAVDSAGNAFIAGQAYSALALLTVGATPGGGRSDGFVAMLGPNGSQPALGQPWYNPVRVGGAKEEAVCGLVLDLDGNVCITGWTTSPSTPAVGAFPTVGAYQSTYGGVQDAFVAKVNPAGSGFVYSTYLGGAGFDGGQGIAALADRSVVVTGRTRSVAFPRASAYQATYAGGEDAFVTRLAPDGATLTFSTFLGGKGQDAAYAVTADPSGNLFITGGTRSYDFPVTNGAYDTAQNGGSDAFFSILTSAGTMLYNTYFGGGLDDCGRAIAYWQGCIYLTGTGQSADFPTTASAFRTANSGTPCDPFVAKFPLAEPTWIYVANRTAAIAETINLVGTLFQRSGSVKLVGKPLKFLVDGSEVGTAITGTSPNLGIAALSYKINDALGVGAHTVTVIFAGDVGYRPSIARYTLNVTPAVTHVTAYDAYVSRGMDVTLRARLTRLDGAMPSKTLSFTVDGILVGSALTDPSGLATVSYTASATMTMGNHPVVVSFAGDAWNLSSAGTSTLKCIEASWILMQNTTAAIFSRPALSARLMTTLVNRPLVGKTLTFIIDGASVGTAITDAAGFAVLTYPITEALAPGDHTLSARFLGDPEATWSVAAPVTLTITKGQTTLTGYDATVTIGATTTLRATLSSLLGAVGGKTVTFSVDAGAPISAVTNATGLAAIRYTAPVGFPVGTHTVTVAFAGDANCLPVAAVTKTLTVGVEITSLYVGDRTVAIYDNPNLVGQLKGLPLNRGLNDERVSFSVDGTFVGEARTNAAPISGGAILPYPISDTMTVGAHVVTATYSGRQGFTASCTGTGTLTVTKANSILTAAAASVKAGAPVDLTATLRSNAPTAAGRTVTFSIAGSIIGSATTNASGVATFSYTPPAAGSFAIDVAFAGDRTLNASTGAATLTVVP